MKVNILHGSAEEFSDRYPNLPSELYRNMEYHARNDIRLSRRVLPFIMAAAGYFICEFFDIPVKSELPVIGALALHGYIMGRRADSLNGVEQVVKNYEKKRSNPKQNLFQD